MTAFPGAGSALDRVGGQTTLVAALEVRPYPRTGLTLAAVEELGTPRRFFSLALVDEDGRAVGTLRTVEAARASAIRDDQLRLLEDDAVELTPLLRSLAAELDGQEEPLLERLLDGDR
jgi:hypothetical protein